MQLHLSFRILVKIMYKFADIGVCDDASNTGMGGYNDYFFSSSQFFFLFVDFPHICTPVQRKQNDLIVQYHDVQKALADLREDLEIGTKYKLFVIPIYTTQRMELIKHSVKKSYEEKYDTDLANKIFTKWFNMFRQFDRVRFLSEIKKMKIPYNTHCCAVLYSFHISPRAMCKNGSRDLCIGIRAWDPLCKDSKERSRIQGKHGAFEELLNKLVQKPHQFKAKKMKSVNWSYLKLQFNGDGDAERADLTCQVLCFGWLVAMFLEIKSFVNHDNLMQNVKDGVCAQFTKGSRNKLKKCMKIRSKKKSRRRIRCSFGVLI